MTKKLSLEVLSAKRIGNLFHVYSFFEKDIISKVKKEVNKKIYFVPERRKEMYFKRLKTEYLKWAKNADIPSHIKEAGWEFYMRD